MSLDIYNCFLDKTRVCAKDCKAFDPRTESCLLLKNLIQLRQSVVSLDAKSGKSSPPRP